MGLESRKIADIVIGDRHRKNMGDLKSLAASIETIGLLHPPVILPNGKLVVGERRIKAAQLLGWDEISVRVASSPKTAAELIRAEADENTCRKDFDPTEAYQVGIAIEEAYRPVAEAAREKSRSKAGKASGKARANAGETFPTVKSKRDESARTRAVAAAAVGRSDRTWEKLKAVVESGDEALVAEMDRTGKVDRAYKRLKVNQATRQTVSLPEGVYDLILADPPWQYDFAETHRREIENHYTTMASEEIARLTPPAADNCVLFMWATAPKMREAFEVLDGWGFVYKTHAVWDKQKIGMGYWFRGQHELLLVGTRGKVSPPNEDVRSSSILSYPRGKHSAKPHEVYELLEGMFPHATKCEMFARETRDGWTAWGNQV